MVCAHAKSSPYAIWSQASPGGASFCLLPLLLLQPALQKTFAPCAVMSQPVCFAQVTANAVTKSCSNHSQCCGKTSAWMSHYKKNSHIVCIHGIHHSRTCGRCSKNSDPGETPGSSEPAAPPPPYHVMRRIFDEGTGRSYLCFPNGNAMWAPETTLCGRANWLGDECVLIQGHVGGCRPSTPGVQFVEVRKV